MVPICDGEQQCQCDSDVQWGRIGQFSEMDVAPDGTIWVSAYNAYHGDLMIAARDEDGRIPDEAWQFVDGVPDGPVLVPDSDIRGGINEPGPDVGLYTDIAAAGDGAVVVSHFDQDTASLRFTSNRSGAWVTHVIDEGVPAPAEEAEGATFEIAGQYSAISIDLTDRPGVAYFAHVSDADGARTELRFAQAATSDPTQASDWTVSVIDSAAVPAPSSDPLPIPMGVGLFVNAARLADGSPVVVYYDRVNGDLKSARFNAGAGAFDPPQVLDGASVDVGWYPSVAVDAADVLHVSYVSAANHDLLYLDTQHRRDRAHRRRLSRGRPDRGRPADPGVPLRRRRQQRGAGRRGAAGGRLPGRHHPRAAGRAARRGRRVDARDLGRRRGSVRRRLRLLRLGRHRRRTAAAVHLGDRPAERDRVDRDPAGPGRGRLVRPLARP